MLWHVSSCIWLMLLTIALNSDQLLLKETANESLDKQKFRYNEVADFADVVEPIEEEKKHEHREKKDVDDEVARKTRDEETDASTLRVALELNSDSLSNNKQFDLSLEGKEEANIINQHKRSIPRKYTNILDLKYYYSKGLPIRGHLSGNAPQLKARKRAVYEKREKKRARKRNEDTKTRESRSAYWGDTDGLTRKRNPLNIIPMMAENNPYISNLADATNDAYLKMRNYAATLMLILTTPKPQLTEVNECVQMAPPGTTIMKRPYDYVATPKPMTPVEKAVVKTDESSKQIANAEWLLGMGADSKNVLKQRTKKSVDDVLVVKRKYVSSSFSGGSSFPLTYQGNTVNSDLPTTCNFNNNYQSINLPPLTPVSVMTTDTSRISIAVGDTMSSSISRSAFLPGHNSGGFLEGLKIKDVKATTLSPLLWENDLLKEANIKLRSAKPQDRVFSKTKALDADRMHNTPMINDSIELEILDNKPVTSQSMQETNQLCILNSDEQADEAVCDLSPEEEDCTGQYSPAMNDSASDCTLMGHEKKKEKEQECEKKIPLAKATKPEIPENNHQMKHTHHQPYQHELQNSDIDNFNGVLIDGAQMNGRATNGRPTNESSASEGSANAGSANEGSANEGSANEGSANEGSANEEPTNKGSMNGAPTNGGPTNEGAANNECINEEATNEGAKNEGTTNGADKASNGADKASNGADKASIGAESKDDDMPDCQPYWTVSVKDMQKAMTEAMEAMVAPVKQISDIKPLRPGGVSETDSACVRKFLQSTENSSELTFPTVELNLDSMANQLAKSEGQANDNSNSDDSKLTPEVTTVTVNVSKSDSEQVRDVEPEVETDTSTDDMCAAFAADVKATENKFHLNSDTSRNQSIGMRKLKKDSTSDVEDVTTRLMATQATILESDYDDSLDTTDDPTSQLQRLRRDLFVVKELQQLLDKLTTITRVDRGIDINVRNFRDVQNSQYDDDLDIDDDMTTNVGDINNQPVGISKRGLFRKRKRKKKKAKNVWKHIFGVRTDENRFLNQNFPNSQYAKYPM